LLPETVGTRGAKFDRGCNGLQELVHSDVETSSHEVDGQVSKFRREWRPVAAGTGSGPEGSRLTVDIRLVLSVAIVSIFGLLAIWLIISNRRQMQEFEQRQLNYRAEIKAGQSPSVSAPDESGGLLSLLPYLSDPTVQALIKQFLEKKGE